MILEHALLSVRAAEAEAFEAAFAEASALLARQTGYRGHRLEDHVEGFRGGPDYPEWKRRLHHFYEPFPEVLHFESVTRGVSES